MIPAEAAKALLAHLNVPAQHISVWVHRAPDSPPGANPVLHVAINPNWKLPSDRVKIPGRFGDYLVEKQEWSQPIAGEIPEIMLEPER